MKNPHEKLNVLLKRAYEDASPQDGYRVLVDRVWPRGRSKAVLKLDQWARDLTPSVELRKWFGHDPRRWEVFRKRYLQELANDAQSAQLRQLLADAPGRTITLVYGAKDEEHNQAIVLREALLNLFNS